MADECVFMWEMFLQIITVCDGNVYLVFFLSTIEKLKKFLGALCPKSILTFPVWQVHCVEEHKYVFRSPL